MSLPIDDISFENKTRSIILIGDVFFCSGGNNLSIGVGLLRSAAKRRIQLNIKRQNQHFVPRQISKEVLYPSISMALWGFSKPWTMNRLLNIGFRQDSIQQKFLYTRRERNLSNSSSSLFSGGNSEGAPRMTTSLGFSCRSLQIKS